MERVYLEQIEEHFGELCKQALEKYYSKLNPIQRQAVFHMCGPLLILAGAGSGKTTVLINRIEYMIRFGNAYHRQTKSPAQSRENIAALEAYLNGGSVDFDNITCILADEPVMPWNILAITFTNKAAAELKNRLERVLGDSGSDVHASTFHSFCVRVLRREIEALGYSRSFTIYDSDDSLRIIKDGIRAAQLDEKLLPPRSVLSAIGRAKDSMQSPEVLSAQSHGDYRAACIAKVYSYYQKTLKDANALDFDDIIMLTSRLFAENPTVLEYYQRRYRYVMVDEYQDTNKAQYLLVSLLSRSHQNLCVVGDDDQSIYKFRGATIENILSFEHQFDNAAVIRLEQNYRSTQNILSAANAVISHNTARKGKNLWTDSGEGTKIKLVKSSDELEEARVVADQIMSHVENGGKWSDHAVLYRMNAQSNAVERALAQRGAPYRVVGGVRFYDRKEVRDVVAYLSVIHNPNDNLRLLRIINEPKRGIGAATLNTAIEIADNLGESLFDVIAHADEYAPLSKKSSVLIQFAQMIKSFAELSEEAPIAELMDEVLTKTGYLRSLEAEGVEGITRIENVMELKSNIIKYAQSVEEPSLGGFLEEIALYTDIDNYDQSADTITLMTVHSAKGLEFPRVFIVGMEEGLFPGRAAMNFPDELEEERRLAYVAITRAREGLTITCAERRMIFGQTVYGKPSRFSAEIPAELIEQAAKKSPMRKTAHTPPPKSTYSGANSLAGTGGMKASSSSISVAVGERVVHRVFGEGNVLSSKPMGGDTLLEIKFEKVGIKKVMANFAGLKK